jgi:hypothetical protein
MEPRMVAEKIVTSVRQNQENVFIPSYLELSMLMNGLVVLVETIYQILE